jgi:hypothetical protein
MNTTQSKKSDLTVIVRTKELCSYILTVTEKSPKRFRFTLTSRLQNYALDALEKLYLANEVFVQLPSSPEVNRRLQLQHEAMTYLKLLSYMAELAKDQGCILYKQFEQITKQACDCQNLLGAWIKSDKRRFTGK